MFIIVFTVYCMVTEIVPLVLFTRSGRLFAYLWGFSLAPWLLGCESVLLALSAKVYAIVIILAGLGITAAGTKTYSS